MNWADVSMVLARGLAMIQTADDRATSVDEGASITFISDVIADTDLANMNNTVFVLRGRAKVGIDEQHMRRLFQYAHVLCDKLNISTDPYTWVLIPRPKKPISGWTAIDLISGDETMMKLFMADTPKDLRVEADVTIRAAQS